MPGPNLRGLERYSSTIYGVLIPFPMWIVSLSLILIYAKRHGDYSPATRMPVPFNLKINTSDRLGVFYIWTGHLAISAIPILLNIQLVAKFFDGTYFVKNNCISSPKAVHGVWNLLTKFDDFFSNHDFIFGQCGTPQGIQYFPIITPWLVLSFGSIVVLAGCSLYGWIFFIGGRD